MYFSVCLHYVILMLSFPAQAIKILQYRLFFCDYTMYRSIPKGDIHRGTHTMLADTPDRIFKAAFSACWCLYPTQLTLEKHLSQL